MAGGSRALFGTPAEAATVVEAAAGQQVGGRPLEQSGALVPGTEYPAQRTPTCQRVPRGTV